MNQEKNSKPLLKEDSVSSSLNECPKDDCVISNDSALHVNKRYKFDGLTTESVWGYGVGHFINDTTSGCWFKYVNFINISFKLPALLPQNCSWIGFCFLRDFIRTSG